MDIRQEINKTDTLKNNIKTINNQIKETVIRGGGYDFKSLDKAPKRITDLLKQYRKTAIFNMDEMFNFPSGEVAVTTEILIKTLEFNPKYVMVLIKNGGSGNTYDELVIFDDDEFKELWYYGYSDFFRVRRFINGNSIYLEGIAQDRLEMQHSVRITKIIAIG